jgi:hypothetical protein
MEYPLSQDTSVPGPAPEAAAEPSPDPAPAPSPDPEPDPAVDPAVDPAPAPSPDLPGPAAEVMSGYGGAEKPPRVHKPRRRGRTTLLIAAAAVLGVLAGGGLGYRIQQQRDPTPLPPLTGAMPAQPKGAGPAVPALPASQDRAAIYDGNLLKLLLPVPEGAKDPERDWVSLEDSAERFEQPDDAFRNLTSDGFRRHAEAAWTDAHDVYREVDLLQYRDDVSPQAIALFEEWSATDNGDPHYRAGVQVPGATNGLVRGSAEPFKDPGFEPSYEGRALVQVGNILIEVFVDSTHPVKAATIQSVVTQQLERL